MCYEIFPFFKFGSSFPKKLPHRSKWEPRKHTCHWVCLPIAPSEVRRQEAESGGAGGWAQTWLTSKFTESVNLPTWNVDAVREGSRMKSESRSHGQVICGKWPLRSSGLMWNWPFHFFPLMLNIPEADTLEMKPKHPPLAREPRFQTACTWYMAEDSKVAGGKISSQVD